VVVEIDFEHVVVKNFSDFGRPRFFSVALGEYQVAFFEHSLV
jgi:hypothetical protein